MRNRQCLNPYCELGYNCDYCSMQEAIEQEKLSAREQAFNEKTRIKLLERLNITREEKCKYTPYPTAAVNQKSVIENQKEEVVTKNSNNVADKSNNSPEIHIAKSLVAEEPIQLQDRTIQRDVEEFASLRDEFHRIHAEKLRQNLVSSESEWNWFTVRALKIECGKLPEIRRGGRFKFYRPHTSVKSNWPMHQILDHAMKENNRSRKVCVEMGLINNDEDELTTLGERIYNISLRITHEAGLHVEDNINLISFDTFKIAYNASYNKSFFSNTCSSAMKRKLNSGEFNSMDQVKQYAEDNPDSRTAKVLNKLALTQSRMDVENTALQEQRKNKNNVI